MNSATVLLTSLLFVSSLNLIPLKVESKIIEVPNDYSTIQLAINRATLGDTIKVASGIYPERIEITKPLRLIGEGPDSTEIVGSGTAVLVKADNVEISGFTVRNGTYGIFLSYCSGAMLRNNVMSGNKWNFGIWGDISSHFVHDIDASNIVDGKPICFWVNESGKHVPRNAGYVALVNSANITVEDLSLTSNEQGVLLVNTNSSFVRNVTMLGNDKGISLRWSSNNLVLLNNLISINWQAFHLLSSHNNTLTENTIRNGNYGILAENSNENSIYHNNFLNNKEQQYQLNSVNKWDNGREGNYWSDYKGEDTDGDGIGDTLLPHLEVDYHPLVRVFDEIPPIADAGGNQTVLRDILVSLSASNSSDNIDIVSYLWDFGDGSNGTGITTSHAFTTTGVYKVTLTVIDASGNIATDVIAVTVVDPPVVLPWWLLLAVSGTVAVILALAFWLWKSSETKRTNDKR